MKKRFFLVALLCLAAVGVADAGQFRITPPSNMRKRQPPRNYKESRLEIVNNDDRGYAIDVDYRRNRLTLVSRNSGDMYIPGNSSVTLTFDDDDDWRIEGDNESLKIEIRSGRTTTLRLETRKNRNQIGLFGTVDDGRHRTSKQLFRYADRPNHGRPGPGRHDDNRRPAPQPQRPAPTPQGRPTPPPPPPPQHGGREPSRGTIGSAVGGVIDSLVDNDRPGPRR